jgi:hypothetical protein
MVHESSKSDKKLNKQESIIIPYFENNADPAAVVRFQV